MSGNTNIAIWVMILAAAILLAAIGRAKTAFLGITLVFIYNVASSCLSAFVCGKILGLSEDWLDPSRMAVVQYSSWALLVMALAVLVAWWPEKIGDKKKAATAPAKSKVQIADSQWWINPRMIAFLGVIGLVCMIASTFVVHIPTVGSAVSIFSGLLKVSILLAALHARKTRSYGLFFIALAIFLPISVFNTLRSGFTPLSTDLAIPLVAVLAFYRGLSLPSVIVVALAIPLFLHLMTAWLSVRGTIRSGTLKNLPLMVQASTFVDQMQQELMVRRHNPEEIQSLLFERIDMSDLLSEQVNFQPNGEPYQHGMTVINGLYALVPRAVWQDKPRVIGYADFVSKYTGIERGSGDETAVGVPIEFELYANGGPIFVWVGLFIITWSCAALERTLFQKPLSFEKWFPLLMVLISFMKIVEQITLTAAVALTGFLAAWGISKFIHSYLPELYHGLMGEKSSKPAVQLARKRVLPDHPAPPVAANELPTRKAGS